MEDTHTLNHNDPYASLFHLSGTSPSQEQSLTHTCFVQPNTHHTPSPASADFTPPSNGIVMVSLTDSQDSVRDAAVPQDVFHTPPEESSLPSDDDPCAVNHAVGVDVATQGLVDLCDGSEYVDLGRDSELGFSEVQLTQQMEVAECSRRNCQFDEFGDFERDLSDLGESPGKKSKLTEHDLGFDFSMDYCGVQLQKDEEGIGNSEGKPVCEIDTESPCNLGADTGKEENEISMNKNCCDENFETLVGDLKLCESEKMACTVEGNVSSDGIAEDSGMPKKSDKEPVLRVLPLSMRGCLENAASELERGNGREKKNVFDVLKVLSENSDEVEDDLDDLSLLDVARACGITFPRPRWWPHGDNFNP
ncbi:hypothetical protein CR513_29791, partial [Mucuna pruriens]